LELSDLRGDVLHKATTRLVRGYGTIVIEDLNVRGMMRNHYLAGAIARQAWGELRRELEYKSSMLGRVLMVADRFYASTKTCSGCGSVRQVLLSERIYECSVCGLVIDRDVNAAINLSKLPVGNGEGKPVEREALVCCKADETTLNEAGIGLRHICLSS
jgi:putative transposase